MKGYFNLLFFGSGCFILKAKALIHVDFTKIIYKMIELKLCIRLMVLCLRKYRMLDLESSRDIFK